MDLKTHTFKLKYAITKLKTIIVCGHRNQLWLTITLCDVLKKICYTRMPNSS